MFVSDLLVYPAACTRTSNTPIQSFTDFIRRVKNWSGRYFWNYVVQGETDDNNPSSLSRDLRDAEEEMEKFHSSTNARLASVSNYNRHKINIANLLQYYLKIMPFACSCNSYMMIMHNVRFLLSFVSSFHLLYIIL